MYIAPSKETKTRGHRTRCAALRQPLHFISYRQFSMFTSSLSAWETLMEESQGGNGALSLWVTTAEWFNGNVCQKAEQQPVNQQAVVTYAHRHSQAHAHCPKKHNGEGLSKKNKKTLPSLLLSLPPFRLTQTHKIKKQKHICPKRFWQELRQAEMNTEALRAHSEKSTVRKTHITGSPPTRRGDECQKYARCIKRHRCYQSGLQEIPPNKVLLSSLQKSQRGNQPKQM